MTEPRYPTVHVDVPADQTDEVSALLFELGATGVEERDGTTLDRTENAGKTTLVAHFDDEDQALIVAETSAFPARVEYIVGDEWKHKWREFFKPSRVGRNLVVKPSWEAFDTKPSDVVLTLDPGQAFGTGTHETTRLVLAELEDLVLPDHRVLDVGCGSGILAIGTLLLGAKSAVGVDIDDESMEASRENAERNGVLKRFKVSKRSVTTLTEAFDLVVANIESRVLVPLAASITARIAPGGHLVLSGLLSHEEEELLEVYTALGMKHQRTSREKDWIAMVWAAPVKAVAKKAVAKPVAKKAAAKPVAKKAAAKPVAKKTVAKPVAKKAAAKTVAKKAVAKPVAKQAFAKPVAKKAVAKPVAKKTVAKPVARKAVAKPVAKKAVAKKVFAKKKR